jgi:hypothetical protein
VDHFDGARGTEEGGTTLSEELLSDEADEGGPNPFSGGKEPFQYRSREGVERVVSGVRTEASLPAGRRPDDELWKSGIDFGPDAREEVAQLARHGLTGP